MGVLYKWVLILVFLLGIGYFSYCGCDYHERMVCCCLEVDCDCVLCRTR